MLAEVVPMPGYISPLRESPRQERVRVRPWVPPSPLFTGLPNMEGFLADCRRVPELLSPLSPDTPTDYEVEDILRRAIFLPPVVSPIPASPPERKKPMRIRPWVPPRPVSTVPLLLPARSRRVVRIRPWVPFPTPENRPPAPAAPKDVTKESDADPIPRPRRPSRWGPPAVAEHPDPGTNPTASPKPPINPCHGDHSNFAKTPRERPRRPSRWGPPTASASN